MDHYGYAGKILRVNLESGDIGIEQPEASYYQRYLGGRGIIMHTLLTEVPAKADPLGAENKLIFALGLFNRTQGDRLRTVQRRCEVSFNRCLR